MSKNLSFNELNRHNWQDFFKHYANYRNAWTPLTLEENLALIETYQKGGKEGEKAINKLTNQYIAYVASIVKKCVPFGENWSDLLQEGLLVFNSCLKKYDPKKGHPAPYVKKCIRSAMKINLKYSPSDKLELRPQIKTEIFESEEDIYNKLFREEELTVEIERRFELSLKDDQEQEIMRKYFGVLGYNKERVVNIAHNEGVTDERIHQIRRKIVERIKKAEKFEPILKDYLFSF